MGLIILAFLVVVLDQITKYIVTNNMVLNESIPIIENVFHFTYILNPGAAFGMLANNTYFLLFIALFCIAGAVALKKYILAEGKMFQYGVALFIGGAIGNVIDRVKNGLVIDFFDFRIWPIFNVADIAICVGVAMAIFSIVKTDFLNKNTKDK